GTKREPARQKYLDQKEYLQAGRTPPATTADGCSLADMVNHYLTEAQERVEGGNLSPLSFRDYYWTGKQMLAQFG
ncbi:MAG: hypothetical protein KDA52_14560, partial [Planctomycetaceae bacterium]|nr:hypothetical protein [Planctomycetaceae bacterium]